MQDLTPFRGHGLGKSESVRPRFSYQILALPERLPMLAKELLLAKAWSTHLEKWLTGLLQGQFQSCRSPLALAAVPQDVPESGPAHGLAKQVASARSKLPLTILPPCVECFRLGPREIFVWVHTDIFILRGVGRSSFEAFGPFAIVMQGRGLSLRNNMKIGQTIHCLPSIRSATNDVLPQAFHNRAVSAVPPSPARSNQ
jgi:hypothetical protein